MRARWGMDLLAVLAGLVALGMVGVYAAVIAGQHDDGPAWWVVLVLVAAGVLCLAGGSIRLPRRRLLLAAAAVLLWALGVLAILSIGLPILLAAVLAVTAAALPTPVAPAG